MFELSEEQSMLRDLVARFVDEQLMPLERAVLAREASGGVLGLSEEEEGPLLSQCRELGLWGLDVPAAYGGANLSNLDLMVVNEELGRTCVPFTFPPDSPNLHMLLAVANDEQKKKYLQPYAEGTAHSAIAISEPGAGADPAGMLTRATRDGDDWVINGRKIWISRIPKADFTIVMARTGEGNARPASAPSSLSVAHRVLSSSARSPSSVGNAPTKWSSMSAACRRRRYWVNWVRGLRPCNCV